MGELISNNHNLELHHNVIVETAIQINKDFAVFNEDVYPDPGIIQNEIELREPLFKTVAHLLKSDKRKMMQIIYRVDISENTLGKQLSSVSANDASEELSMMIIKREMQKILIRRNIK